MQERSPREPRRNRSQPLERVPADLLGHGGGRRWCVCCLTELPRLALPPGGASASAALLAGGPCLYPDCSALYSSTASGGLSRR